MRGRTSPPLFPDVVEGTVHLRPYEGRGKEYLLRTKTREVGLHMVRVPLPVSFCMKSLWQLPATETAVLSLRGDLSIIEEKRSCRWDGAAWKPSRELAASRPARHGESVAPAAQERTAIRSAAGRIIRHTQAMALCHRLQPGSAVVSAVVVGTSFVSRVSA